MSAAIFAACSLGSLYSDGGNNRSEGNGPEYWIPYDNDFLQITPAPEPATYGVIFGAVGLGLFGWRKRKQLAPLSLASKQ